MSRLNDSGLSFGDVIHGDYLNDNLRCSRSDSIKL
jgi:hypothetical protein